MSLLRVSDGPPVSAALMFHAGRTLVKEAAVAEPAYNLAGQLYLSSSGWLLLSVPNALARGVFSAMTEPGIELPPYDDDPAKFNAHVSVMSKDDLTLIGGPERVTERGKTFAYTLGRLYGVEPDDWPGVSKVWYVKVHSPELQALRRSYGLTGLPHRGEYDFHITVGVRRKGVLGRGQTAKG